MKKIYELNVLKCSGTYVNDSESHFERYRKKDHNSKISGIEGFIDSELFEGDKLYFEDEEKANTYVDSFLDALKSKNELTDPRGNQIEYTVLDIEKDQEECDDGLCHVFRIVVKRKDEMNYNAHSLLYILTYEWQIYERSIME